MNPELQKLVDAGTLTAPAGEALSKLSPGTYCSHKSWGFGKVAEWNLLVNQILIDFQSKKAHPMQLLYASETLQPLLPEHILVRKAEDLNAVKKLATDNPVELMRITLQSIGGKGNVDQIAAVLSGDVIPASGFKKWWDAARKHLKKDGHFTLPNKRTEPVILRDEAMSQSSDLVTAFLKARQLKEQIRTAELITKDFEEFADPLVELKPVVEALNDVASKAQPVSANATDTQIQNAANAMECIILRDELCAMAEGLRPGPESRSLPQMIREQQAKVGDIISALPAARQRRALSALPDALGEAWPVKAISLLNEAGLRLVSEICRLFETQGIPGQLVKAVERGIQDHSATSETLYVVCKEREGLFKPLVHPRMLGAILSGLERDQHKEARRSAKMHDLMLEDRELMHDLLESGDKETLRDCLRSLMLTPVFEELNKRSLMARIIKMHPELESMLSGESESKQENLIVSWSSLAKRKEELEELVTKKIPENTKEISVARSYGDLRENFEFKAAKEMQSVLMRRKAELEMALDRARGTNFENPDTSMVSIGTKVYLRDVEKESENSYTILGAWDSAPENGIISYLAGFAQGLLGHKAGETLELPTELGNRRFEILKIEAYTEMAGAAA